MSKRYRGSRPSRAGQPAGEAPKAAEAGRRRPSAESSLEAVQTPEAAVTAARTETAAAVQIIDGAAEQIQESGGSAAEVSEARALAARANKLSDEEAEKLVLAAMGEPEASREKYFAPDAAADADELRQYGEYDRAWRKATKISDPVRRLDERIRIIEDAVKAGQPIKERLFMDAATKRELVKQLGKDAVIDYVKDVMRLNAENPALKTARPESGSKKAADVPAGSEITPEAPEDFSQRTPPAEIIKFPKVAAKVRAADSEEQVAAAVGSVAEKAGSPPRSDEQQAADMLQQITAAEAAKGSKWGEEPGARPTERPPVPEAEPSVIVSPELLAEAEAQEPAETERPVQPPESTPEKVAVSKAEARQSAEAAERKATETLQAARNELVRAQKAVRTGEGFLKKLFRRGGPEVAQKELAAAQEAYEKARTEYVGAKAMRALEERLALHDARVEELADKKGGWIRRAHGAYRKLGEINLNKIDWYARNLGQNKLGKFVGKIASVRTGISLALLGGSAAVGIGSAAGLGVLAARRLLAGTGSAVGSYDLMRSVKEDSRQQFRSDEVAAMSLEEIAGHLDQMEASARLDGRALRGNGNYESLQAEFAKMIEADNERLTPEDAAQRAKILEGGLGQMANEAAARTAELEKKTGRNRKIMAGLAASIGIFVGAGGLAKAVGAAREYFGGPVPESAAGVQTAKESMKSASPMAGRGEVLQGPEEEFVVEARPAASDIMPTAESPATVSEAVSGSGEESAVRGAASEAVAPEAPVESVELKTPEAAAINEVVDTVKPGEGYSQMMIRELQAHPDKFGFQGDATDAGAVAKWAKATTLQVLKEKNYMGGGAELRMMEGAEVKFTFDPASGRIGIEQMKAGKDYLEFLSEKKAALPPTSESMPAPRELPQNWQEAQQQLAEGRADEAFDARVDKNLAPMPAGANPEDYVPKDEAVTQTKEMLDDRLRDIRDQIDERAHEYTKLIDEVKAARSGPNPDLGLAESLEDRQHQLAEEITKLDKTGQAYYDQFLKPLPPAETIPDGTGRHPVKSIFEKAVSDDVRIKPLSAAVEGRTLPIDATPGEETADASAPAETVPEARAALNLKKAWLVFENPNMPTGQRLAAIREQLFAAKDNVITREIGGHKLEIKLYRGQPVFRLDNMTEPLKMTPDKADALGQYMRNLEPGGDRSKLAALREQLSDEVRAGADKPTVEFKASKVETGGGVDKTVVEATIRGFRPFDFYQEDFKYTDALKFQKEHGGVGFGDYNLDTAELDGRARELFVAGEQYRHMAAAGSSPEQMAALKRVIAEEIREMEKEYGPKVVRPEFKKEFQ